MQRSISCAFAVAVAIHLAAGADAHWTRMASPNFEMYTTAGERSARDTIRYFEQVRGLFAQTMPHSTAPSAAVRIVAFSSLKEYQPYRPNDVAIAYYHSSGDHDYIVMSHTGVETFPIAVHEYVHLVVQHAKLKLPPWLNEGLAELYSTVRPMGDKVLVGSIIAGRYQALFREKWVPLETILRADRNSPYYNEKDKAGSLYNEGWALTHMLELSEDYRPKFAEFFKRVSTGTDSATALEQTYRIPLRQIEAELQGYLRAGSFNGVLLPAKLEKIDDEIRSEPADDFEVKLLLAEVGDQPSREEATRAAFQELIRERPDRPEPHVDLGYFDWRHRDRDGAREQFEKAFDLGSRNARLLWDFGRMEESADATRAGAALDALLKQEPERLEVRFELAALEVRAHNPRAALDTLDPVKKVTPEQAPRLFLLMAEAHLAAGNRDEARSAAQSLEKVAASDDDRRRAEQILTYLDRSSARQTAPARAADEPPVIRRRQAPAFEVRESIQEKQRASFSGQFVELQCASPAKIVLQTAQGRKVLMIDDPTRLVVNGNNGETMELSCGRQKAATVRVEYDAPDGRAGIDGVARVIRFGAN